MKPFLIGAALSVLLATSAYAAPEFHMVCRLTAQSPLVTGDPVETINVDLVIDGGAAGFSLDVRHNHRSGRISERGVQYFDFILSKPEGDAWTWRWTARLRTAPDLVMVGILSNSESPDEPYPWSYNEDLYRVSNKRFHEVGTRSVCRE